MKTQGSRPRDSLTPKRVYQKPVIRDYGSLASLTAGDAGSQGDTAMTTMMMMA